jgi:O-antigen/teichoic acid export membrane protein
VWHLLAALLVAADLILAAWGFFPAADPALLDVVPPSIGWLKEHYDPLDPWRLAVYEQPGADTLNANIAWLHGLQDISGYDSLIPAQYAAYMGVIMPQTDLPYNRIAPIYATYPDALDSPLLDLLGVRYVVSETPIDNPRYTLAYQDEAVLIYENAAALPRAFTLPYRSTVTYGAEDSSGWPSFAQTAQQVDVRQHVLIPTPSVPDRPLVERERADLPAGTPGERGAAAITVNTAQEMWIDAEGTDSWLIVTGSYYPGWRAWIRPLGAADDEEQEVTVYLVDGNFRGVYLPEGRWTVRMKFSPDTFRFGAFASFLAGLGLLFALGVWAWRFLYREDPQAGGIQRVAKNTLTPIVLNLFNKGISFVLTFAMLRVLGPAGAGDYRYAIVIYGWFEILVNFGLNTFLTREVARHKEEANRYLANTTILRLALVVLGVPALAGFMLIRQTLVSPPQNPATLIALGLLYGGLFFSTISTGLTALFYAYETAEHPAAIQTVSAFLTTGLGITVLLLGGGIIGLAAVSLAVNVITFAILGALALRLFFPDAQARLRWSFDWRLQKLALIESFPLMINHLLATLFFRVAVVLLEAIKGSVVVGWYSVVYTWVDAIMVIPSYFTLSLFPVMSRQAVEDRGALRRTYLLAVKLMSLISVPVAIFTALLAPFLVNVLGGPQYLPHGAIALAIFIWSILIGWINSVTQYVIIALNRQRTLTVAFAVVAVFAVAANLIAIPRYSYPAAAVVAILSEGVLWALFYLVIRGEMGGIGWPRALWRIAAAGLVTGGAAFGLGQINMWLGFAAGVIVYSAALFVLRPFSAEELRQLAPALPGAVRRVLQVG